MCPLAPCDAAVIDLSVERIGAMSIDYTIVRQLREAFGEKAAENALWIYFRNLDSIQEGQDREFLFETARRWWRSSPSRAVTD
jgi:hypothetical protein